MLDPVLEQKMDEIAERIFGTQKDPEQIPITKESGEKLEALTPHWIKYKLDGQNNPIAWVMILPTSLELMTEFLEGRINERELLDLTKPQDTYEALYLCAAITVPEYRRRGYAVELLIEGINSIPHDRNVKLFAWPHSSEGEGLIEKIEKLLNTKVLIRNK